MQNIDLNDFIMEILQDFIEIQSMLKVLKDSAYNENSEITMIDVGNTIEVIVAKVANTKHSLDKYIDTVFK